SPRPDEVLDNAVKSVTRDGIMYHYVLPAPHVLLTPAGPIVFALKYQTGVISADGDKWSQKGLGFRRFFGQEGLGNPTKDAESMVKSLAGYISKQAPEIEEVNIGAMIVFTSKNRDELDVKGSRIPAMHSSKVKGFLKQKGKGEPLPEAEFEALRAAFDEAAGDLV
ncbi:MAG TPA: nuclease-related domain-containing protein, partial [Anaerolineae bacterium]|nr:nuclease-related domain-containing protein [Anaerolineae bacterium]